MRSNFGADDFRIVIGDAALARHDYGEARRAYTSAAKAGIAAGQHNLAVMYQEGLGVTVDYLRALELYRKAAEQGSPPSQINLGLMLYHGQGVAVDYREALTWIERGAIQGFAAGEYVLGAIYEKGLAVEKDMRQAFEWFERAARHGHPQAAQHVLDRRKLERDRQTVIDAAREAGTTMFVLTSGQRQTADPSTSPQVKTPAGSRAPEVQERLQRDSKNTFFSFFEFLFEHFVITLLVFGLSIPFAFGPAVAIVRSLNGLPDTEPLNDLQKVAAGVIYCLIVALAGWIYRQFFHQPSDRLRLYEFLRPAGRLFKRIVVFLSFVVLFSGFGVGPFFATTGLKGDELGQGFIAVYIVSLLFSMVVVAAVLFRKLARAINQR
jgi:hypothetical protein